MKKKKSKKTSPPPPPPPSLSLSTTRPPPYPFPFYPPPPPPHWSAFPGGWPIPPPGFTPQLPPPGYPIVSSGPPFPPPQSFGMWPPPMMIGMPPSTSTQVEMAIVPPERSVQEAPPLRKRPVTRRSVKLSDGKVQNSVSSVERKRSRSRRAKSKKCEELVNKVITDHDKVEANVVDEQESPKEAFSAVETSGDEENSAPLPKLGSEPSIGLHFASEDEAYEFYNAYAKEKGFSIRKSHIQRSRVDRSVISREYVCANQGFRSTNDRRYKGKVVRPRRETRVDCRAAMSIKRRSSKWVVDRFHKEHNHGLADPAKAERLRSHRKITSTTKSVIDALYKCRIGPSKIIDVITKATSGENGIEISCLDLMKYTKRGRKNNIGVDCYLVLDYFQGIQAVDPGFFCAVEVGENRSMRSIFWADSRAREAYKQFGDVIIFNKVCQTNKDVSPFVSFTGVNHHRQPVLFGCGFLADESVESFVWLLETFLKAMSNKFPTSIITYQDKAMVVSIRKVFPNTRHRFCMLHIQKKELENLSDLFNMHPDFQIEYRNCVYSSKKPEEFESDWEAILMKYNLKENSWLNDMYEQRHHWMQSYLKDTFYAGFSTARLNDGMNYFDGFIDDETPLPAFIPQYEQAIKKRREEEGEEDFMTMYTGAGSTSKNLIEEQALRVYTRNISTMFSHEIFESSAFIARKISMEEHLSKYLVEKFNDKDVEMETVTLNTLNNNASCSCQMFEFEGILCRHVLKVFQEVNVLEIPPKYILKRWTISARCAGSSNEEDGGAFQDPSTVILKGTAIKFVELGASSIERINAATNIIEDGMKQLSLVNVSTSVVPPENSSCNSVQGEKVNDAISNESSLVKLRDRLASPKGKANIKHVQNKKRKCGKCKKEGHYTNTCPKGSVNEPNCH